MRKQRKLTALLAAVLFAAAMCSCSGSSPASSAAASSAAPASSPEAAPAAAPAAVTRVADVPVPEVPDVTPARENGVITAEEWEAHYPEIVASQKANAENTERVSYPEENPNIQILYEGMAFSFDYTSAIGHAYTLDDIGETTRPHKLANCLTCKTPDYTALVNKLGDEAYSLPFEEVYPDMNESVSCYSCHGNTPGTIVLESKHAADAWNDELAAGTLDGANAACAQCHVEYYFDPETKATKVPYDSMEGTGPDAILAFYNETGFTDYTNSNSGTKQIKVQHPEFETFTGAGSVHAGTFNCADCHMGVSYAGDGTPYVNHKFTSPLDNQALLDSTCSACHADLAADVAKIQQETTAREEEVSNLLVELNGKLAAAVADGSKTEEELDAIRAVNRDAQFYWDFVYVENSEGAHNSKLSKECLDKAEQLCKQALEMF